MLSTLLTELLGRQYTLRGDESCVARYKTSFNMHADGEKFAEWLCVAAEGFCRPALAMKVPAYTWVVSCDTIAMQLTLVGLLVINATPCEMPMIDTVESSENMVTLAQTLLQPDFVSRFDCPACSQSVAQVPLAARDATPRGVRALCRRFRSEMRDWKLSDAERRCLNVGVYYDDERAEIIVEARWCGCDE